MVYRAFLWKVKLLFAFFFYCVQVDAQHQKVADSLILVYESDLKIDEAAKMNLLHQISANHTVSSEKIKYAELLIRNAQEHNDAFWMHKGFMELGSGYRLRGDLDLALEAYINSSEAAKGIDFREGIGGSYAAIADIYSINNNSRNAIQYYLQAIDILSKTSDSIVYATVLLNTGDEYFNSGDYNEALRYFEESGHIFKNIEYPIGTAYNLGNIGMVYAKTGYNKLAEKHINDAIEILEGLEDYYPISVYLTYMSDIYVEKNDIQTALEYALKSLHLAELYRLKEQISDANLKLSELYELYGQPIRSLQHYRAHIIYRDSVNNIEKVQQMADLRTDFEVSQKQIEVDLLRQQRKNQRIINIAAIVTSILIFLLALGLYKRYQFIKLTKKIIEEEKERSDNLLLNILPEETAKELKEKGSVKAKKFESVTVLFTDFKEFTKLAGLVEPEQLVKSLDYYFKAFDEITTRYGLEKIKTIGDAYMCASGIPLNNKNHAKNAMLAAIEMLEFVKKNNALDKSIIQFEIRIGLHTGPVIAGIVGNKKWQYDIWGDTVNIASRMESNSESGRINLSETTFQHIKGEFECKFRGEIEVKNRGTMKMYFLEK